MARTAEGDVKKRISAALKSLGPDRCYFFMPVMGEMGASGQPDYVCCVDGRFLAIEAKRGKAIEPTTRQKFRIEDIKRAGGQAIVVHKDNIESFEKLIERIKNGSGLSG